MVSVDFVTQVLSVLSFIGGAFILGFLGVLIYHKIWGKKELKFGFLEEYSLLFAFLIALAATLGSLFYSEIAGYIPCKLCWFQRIFMYPLVLIFGIALVRKARDIIYYTIPLTVIGGAISIYHYTLQRAESVVPCVVGEVSCNSRYISHLGDMTIPMMTIIAFGLIIIFSYLWNRTRR